MQDRIRTCNNTLNNMTTYQTEYYKVPINITNVPRHNLLKRFLSK